MNEITKGSKCLFYELEKFKHLSTEKGYVIIEIVAPELESRARKLVKLLDEMKPYRKRRGRLQSIGLEDGLQVIEHRRNLSKHYLT